MKRALIVIIAVCIIMVISLGLYLLPIPHQVNHTIDGYIIYENGYEMNCNVTIEGKYQDYLFDNDRYKDIFDGTIYVNGVATGISDVRITFSGEAGHTSYLWDSSDASRNETTIKRIGDVLLNKECSTAVVSCNYDNINNTDTANETYRCLIIAPAKNSEDAQKIIASFNNSGHLENFDTWNFNKYPFKNYGGKK